MRDRFSISSAARRGLTSPRFSADLAPLVERTFRYTYMLATKMRDDLIEDGQNEALERLIAEARKLQSELKHSETE